LLQNQAIIKLKKHQLKLKYLRKKVKLHQILSLQMIHQKFQPKRPLLKKLLLKKLPHHPMTPMTARIPIKIQMKKNQKRKVKNLYKLQELTKKMKNRKKLKEVWNYLSKVSLLILTNTHLELILNLMEILLNAS